VKKFQSILDSELGVLDKLQDGGIRAVMSMEETIHPSSGNANEASPPVFGRARLFAIEASESQEAEPAGRPRLRRAQRDQVVMQVASLDSLLPEDRRARLVWEYVEGLDLSRLYERVRAVALWFAIAHNLMRAVVLRAQGALVAVWG